MDIQHSFRVRPYNNDKRSMDYYIPVTRLCSIIYINELAVLFDFRHTYTYLQVIDVADV